MRLKVDKENLLCSELLYAAGSHHKIPNVNSIRCDHWFFRKHRPFGPLLDFGSGSGLEAIYFAEEGYTVEAIDAAPSAKAHLEAVLDDRRDIRDKITVRLIGEDEERLPYAEETFDFLHSSQTLYQLPSEESVKALILEWHRVLKPGALFMVSTVGPGNTLISQAREVAPRIYETKYYQPQLSRYMDLHSYYFEDERHIRDMFEPFEIEEIGWFTNHYCDFDGFHWQILGRKAVAAEFGTRK